MAIFNFGSINIDHVYRVDRFAEPGETILVEEYSAGLGGKGANQSIAAARAGAKVRHIGAVGSDGAWILERFSAEGIDTVAILTSEKATGHAVIQVDNRGENLILVHSGSNAALSPEQVETAVREMESGDWLLFQNETNLTSEIAAAGKARGVKVAYSAAPFVVEKTQPILGDVDFICVNALEAETLARHIGCVVSSIPVARLLVTHGSDGAEYRTAEGSWRVAAFPVEAVDSTGAGDTFLGYFLAALDQGEEDEAALAIASAAAAIQVTRPGAADAIPRKDETKAFLARCGD